LYPIVAPEGFANPLLDADPSALRWLPDLLLEPELLPASFFQRSTQIQE